MRWWWVIVVVLAGPACTNARQDNGVASAGGGGVAVTGTRPSGVYDEHKWITCLREHGITVDDPDRSQPGGGKPHIYEELVSKEQFDAAAQACQQFNTNFGQPNLPMDPAEVETLRKFAECMREHGFPWDDPGAGGGTDVLQPPEAGQPTPSGPEFDKAIKECGDRVPGVIAPEDGTKKEGK